MKQTGLAGDFLSEHASEGESAHQAGQAKPSSASQESEKAQKRANLVLAALFLAGMGCVYMLSLHDDITKAEPIEKAREAVIDTAVKQFAQGPPPGATSNARESQTPGPVELAREMIMGTAQRQIPLDNLKTNPFVLVPNKPVAVKSEPAKPIGITPGATAVQKAEALKLQSIVVANNRSLAIISDRLVTVGQEVGGWRVHEIGNGQVILKWRDLTYVLRVKQ